LSQKMDSRQRFVLTYAALAMATSILFTLLDSSDLGLFVSAYAIEYFAIRLILNPKMRFKVDLLGLALLILFVVFTVQRVAGILGVSLP
jgi:hypothetical protein